MFNMFGGSKELSSQYYIINSYSKLGYLKLNYLNFAVSASPMMSHDSLG